MFLAVVFLKFDKKDKNRKPDQLGQEYCNNFNMFCMGSKSGFPLSANHLNLFSTPLNFSITKPNGTLVLCLFFCQIPIILFS